jgi:hypothetical protein
MSLLPGPADSEGQETGVTDFRFRSGHDRSIFTHIVPNLRHLVHLVGGWLTIQFLT